MEEGSETIKVESHTTDATIEGLGTWQTRSEAGVSRGAEFLKRDEFGFKGLLDVGKE